MKRNTLVSLLFMIALPTACLLSLAVGSADIPLPDLLSGLFWREGFATESTILYAIRLPRLAAALVAGAGLSLSGVLLQAVMGNPLASPNTIGVNAGAGLFTVLFLSFLPNLAAALPLAAFLGALVAALIILAIARATGNGGSHTIILAGIACTSLFQAAISFFHILDDDVLVAYNAFAVGSFEGVTLSALPLPAILIAVALLISLALSGRIAALTLGDEIASSLGIRPARLRVLCLVLACLCAASAVSFAGLLGFVGLMSPHIARVFWGADIRKLLLPTVLVGSSLVVASDLAGRLIVAPSELPVGIIMSLVGAPFFLGLLLWGGQKNA